MPSSFMVCANKSPPPPSPSHRSTAEAAHRCANYSSIHTFTGRLAHTNDFVGASSSSSSGDGWPPSLRGTHAHREIHGRVGDHDKWLSRSPPPLSGGRAARVFGQVFGAICQPVRCGALGERVASDARRKVVRPVGHKRVHGTLACIWFEVDHTARAVPMHHVRYAVLRFRFCLRHSVAPFAT